MNKWSRPSPLRGIIPPLVTPLLGQDELNSAGLERLVEHVIGGGVHGVFILGTTGEAQSLSYDLRMRVIREACARVAGRVPVLVGVTDTAPAESIRLAKVAAEAGADAVVLAPPYYFPAGQPELVEYYQYLAPKLSLPVMLYNMPSHTKLYLEPETVREIADLPCVLGLKDSSANMMYYHRVFALMRDRPDFSLLVGPEEYLAETVLMGGHGGVNGGANFAPAFYVKLYETALAGDLPKLREMQAVVMKVSRGIYGVGKHSSSYLKGTKCALSLLGICDDVMAEPFRRFFDTERAKVKSALQELGFLS